MSTSMPSSQMIAGGGHMPDHLPCTSNSADGQPFIFAFPNTPTIQNCPIISNTLKHAHSNWGSNSSQQQTANISSGSEGLGSQTQRYLYSWWTYLYWYWRHPRQPSELHLHTTTPRSRRSTSTLYPCIIPGCDQTFRRTDYRGNHLRRRHNIPVPKGSWAHTWILRAENRQYLLEAVVEQA